MSVSVVMPAFNAEAHIDEAIESVLAQSYGAFELIVVDDGSTDRTSEIVRAAADADTRVRRIRSENGGTMRARNLGIAAASGEFVATLDADDVMLRARLEHQVAFMGQNPEVAAAGTYVHYINGAGERIGSFAPSHTRPDQLRTLHEANRTFALHHPSTMIRRRCLVDIGGYREQFDVAGDFDLWLRLLDAGHDLAIIEDFLTSYRIHSSSLSVRRAVRQGAMARYASACSAARRAGTSEPTPQEFVAMERSMPWPTRLDRRRKDVARALYANAVRSYATRDFARFAVQFAGATLLRPLKTVTSAVTRVRSLPEAVSGLP